MECTDRYYETLARELADAGLLAGAINSKLIHDYQAEDNSLRKVKSNKTPYLVIFFHTS